MVPSMQSLLEVVDRTLEEIYMVKARWIYKARELQHVNGFNEMTIKKCVAHFNVME